MIKILKISIVFYLSFFLLTKSALAISFRDNDTAVTIFYNITVSNIRNLEVITDNLNDTYKNFDNDNFCSHFDSYYYSLGSLFHVNNFLNSDAFASITLYLEGKKNSVQLPNLWTNNNTVTSQSGISGFIPEPVVMLLLGMGLINFAGIIRKKQKNQSFSLREGLFVKT